MIDQKQATRSQSRELAGEACFANHFPSDAQESSALISRDRSKRPSSLLDPGGTTGESSKGIQPKHQNAPLGPTKLAKYLTMLFQTVFG